MSTINFQSNMRAVIKSLIQKKRSIEPALRLGIKRGLRSYEAWFVKAQLSGRPGLNRISGAAARDWFINESNAGNEYAARLATSRRYLAAHQHANGFNGWIYPKNAKFLHFKTSTIKTTSKWGASLKRAKRVYGDWIFAKKVYLPKRLTILENFKGRGQILIRNEVIKSLQQAMKD